MFVCLFFNSGIKVKLPLAINRSLGLVEFVNSNRLVGHVVERSCIKALTVALKTFSVR